MSKSTDLLIESIPPAHVPIRGDDIPDSWFTSKIQFTSLVEVTPSFAQKLLDKHNGKNPRTIEPAHVEHLSYQMSQHLFETTGCGGTMCWDGHLADMQHRAAAVVKSGVTITMPITFGADPGSRKVLDIELRLRTASQQLGITNKLIEGSLKRMITLIGGRGRHRVNGKMLEQYIEEFAKEVEFVDSNFTDRQRRNTAVLAGTLAFCLRASPGKVKDFTKTLMVALNTRLMPEGASIVGTPVHTLFAYLMDDLKESPAVQSQKILRAVYAHIKDQKLVKLQVERNDTDKSKLSRRKAGKDSVYTQALAFFRKAHQPTGLN